MNARVLLILLIISVLLAFSQRYRKVGVGLSVILVVLLLWFSIQPPPPAQLPTISSSSSSSAIPKPSAQLVTMQLDGAGAPWRLTGTVQNTSAQPIRSVTINIERWDCPTADAARETCVLLWQGTRVVHATVPADTSVKVNDSFYSHDPIARLQGVARDLLTITKAE